MNQPNRPTRADAGGRAYLDLQNLARRQHRNTQALLVTYVLERFLARLAAGKHSDQFVLKGGMLLAVWQARRATVDGDFLARSITMNEQAVLDLIVQVASTPAPVEDGVDFDASTARASTIREDDAYGGVRVQMNARVGRATVKLSVDISTGDPVTPAPARMNYPTLRDGHPAPVILGYPLQTVLAEKICTAVELEAGNTRVRDYADVWTLTAGEQPITADDVRTALQATATHRNTRLQPLSTVIGDLVTARADTYARYRRRQGLDAAHLPTNFADLVADVIDFADPILSGAATGTWHSATRSWI